MSTYTDTVRISLATPDDIRQLAERNLHLWVGASSPLWAPFWTAASFGVGLWSLGQAMARTMGDTIYDRDVSLALKWPGFEALPKPVETHPLESTSEVVEKTADIAEDSVAAANDAVEKTEAVAADTVETVTAAAETVPTPVGKIEDAPETVAEETVAATSKAAKASAELAKKAAAATLDLLGQPAVPAGETRPLIDPVTEKPVIPAVVEAAAEPKLPMPKPAPRRPRKG